MSPAITAILTALAAVVEPLSGFTKAVVPAALGLATAVVNTLVSGSFDAVTITSLAGGLLVAVVVYFVPNKPKAVAAAPKKPAAS